MTEFCERCGGEMVPGIPGEIYCPNDECFKADWDKAVKGYMQSKRKREIREAIDLLQMNGYEVSPPK